MDTTAPDASIAAGPSGTVPATSATFAFSSTDVTATFQCSLDGVTFAGCASPATYSALADGLHTFQVRAVDAVGNVGTPATASWLVDATAPDTTIDSAPDDTTASTSATFAFSSPDSTATFQCSLDGADVAPCTSPLTFGDIADGTHVFTAAAVDPAGNADPTPASRTWTISVAPPETTITAGPSGLVDSATATFSFTSDDQTATFECSLDDAVFAACATPETYSGLAQGAHTFQVRAVNGAGTDATPDSRSFTVDTVAPTVTARTPAPGDNDVAFGATVTATFSEAIAPATLTTETFTLTRNGMPVTGALVLDAPTSTAAFTPASPLAPNATYVATLVGGPSGIADPVGNALAADVAWTFTTPPQLTGAGDIADCAGGNQQGGTAALLAGIPGDVFAAGDTAYPHGSATDFASCYDPSWGLALPRTHPAIGNHELDTQYGLPYYQYFGQTAGTPWVGYYSYDLGTWHVVVLNSNCDTVGCDAGSTQETWLRNDLAAHPSACTLAVWHHPRYSSGGNGSSTRVAGLYQALYDYGADVLVVGHDHDYERFDPQGPFANADPSFGIREFVAGTGGETLGSRASHQPNSVVFAKVWGVLRLVLHPAGYDWQFVPIAGSTFTDSGHGDCHGAPAAAPTPPSFFADGFESDLGGWTVKTSGGGSAALQRGTVRTGDSALQLSATSAVTSSAYARRALSPALTEVTASTDFRVAAEGAAGGNVSALRLFDTAGSRVLGLYRVNGTGEVWLKIGTGTYQKISAWLPLDTWTRLSVHVVVGSAGASTVEVYKDGWRAYSTTTATLGTYPIASVELGNDTTAQAFSSVADNVAINAGGP